MSSRERAPSLLRRLPRLGLRLVRHEWALLTSLFRWIARRPHSLSSADTAVPYASEQSFLISVALFVSVTETVVLALVIPWPLVHLVLLLIGLWGVFLVVGMHAACVTRPHVLSEDGSLRLRYGALVDIEVPAERIVRLRLERRHPGTSLLSVDQTGPSEGHPVVDLAVGGQTNVTAVLDRPITFTRPLGSRVCARTIRFWADEPLLTHRAGNPPTSADAPVTPPQA